MILLIVSSLTLWLVVSAIKWQPVVLRVRLRQPSRHQPDRHHSGRRYSNQRHASRRHPNSPLRRQYR